MTAYPTREAIDAAAETIEALQAAIDQSVPGWGATWSGLDTAREILTHLDAFPGLHYPAAEPKPTALQVLRAAHERALGHGLTAETGILGVVVTYAEDHPEWFAGWHEASTTTHGLSLASDVAYKTGDWVPVGLLRTAAEVASQHPHLFGGAEAEGESDDRTKLRRKGYGPPVGSLSDTGGHQSWQADSAVVSNQ